MKKLSYLFIIAFVFATLTSCGAKKKGCGLTSEATDIQPQEVLVLD